VKKTKSGESFYESVVETETFAEDAYSGTFVATGHTASPWSKRHQHAGPPCALLVRAIEQLSIPTPNPLTNRISVDILDAIPLGAIAVTAQVVKEGHFASLVEAELTHAGYSDPIMRVSAWRTRRTPLTYTGGDGDPAIVPAKGPKVKPPATWSKGFGDAVRWRSGSGSIGKAGRTTVWARPKVALVDDEPLTGVPLIALIAGATSTLSPLTDPDHSAFVSTDLSLHSVREPVGEGLWITTESFLDREGVGVATSTLGDKHGPIAVGNQALFLVERAEVRF
jgi:hypothetical protein